MDRKGVIRKPMQEAERGDNEQRRRHVMNASYRCRSHASLVRSFRGIYPTRRTAAAFPVGQRQEWRNLEQACGRE